MIVLKKIKSNLDFLLKYNSKIEFVTLDFMANNLHLIDILKKKNEP